jgi:hypothetical protein
MSATNEKKLFVNVRSRWSMTCTKKALTPLFQKLFQWDRELKGMGEGGEELV